MKIGDLIPYLIELSRIGFTGSITLNFHRGDVERKISKKINEEIKIKKD